MSSKYIYHYTSVESAVSILKNSKFWATDIFFLNDYLEFHYGLSDVSKNFIDINKKSLKRVNNYISKCRNNKGYNKKHINLLKKIKKVFLTIEKYYDEEVLSKTMKGALLCNAVNIISFTKKEDYLRQWMSYCPDNQGICLKLKLSNLKKFASKSKGIKIKKVKYTDSYTDKSRFLNDADFNRFFASTKRILDLCLLDDENISLFQYKKTIKKIRKEIKKLKKSMLFVVNKMVDSSIAVKTTDFSDEKEYRLVQYSNFCKDEKFKNKDIKYRCKNGVIIPYTEIEFDINLIEAVIIGPSINNNILIDGLLSLKESLGLKFDISSSKVTLRSF